MELADNAPQHRFELRQDGQVAAFAEYRLQGGTITFVHTEVLPGHEGEGLGSKLAQYALEDVQGRGLKVVAQCSFIAKYIGKHPQFAALLAPNDKSPP